MSRRKRNALRRLLPTPETPESPGPPAQGFYEDALSDNERERLSEARQIEGLNEEIALLRVKLSQLVADHPDDMDGLVKAVRLLVQAVATKYRLSPQAKDELLNSIADAVDGLGRQMLPNVFKGTGEE